MGLRRFVYYAGLPWSTCQCRPFFPFFPGGDLRLHLPDQLGQLHLALGLCFRIHVLGHALAVDLGGVATLPQVVIELRLLIEPYEPYAVAALPQVVIELGDTPGSRFAVLALDRLKVSSVGRFRRLPLRRFSPGDGPVNFVRRLLPHLVGDMGVDIQRGGTGHMPDDCGQGFHVHPVLQSAGGKGVA